MSEVTPGPDAGGNPYYPSQGAGQQHGGWPYSHQTGHGNPVPYGSPLPPALPPTPYVSGYPGWGQAPVHVAPKSPGVALLCSFLIPGLGTMMNGEAGKGVGILIGWIVSFVLVFVLIGIFGVLGFWIWGMVDAHQGAVRWNAARGIVS